MSYLLLPLLAGIGVAIIAGPLGSVIVWRRLAYFGDTLSHSGLFGITLALALQINVMIGVCIVSLCVAALLFRWQRRLFLGSDTLLGLLSHASLALGLIALSFFQSIQVDVLGFLYGDILSVGTQDVIEIYLGCVGGLMILGVLWKGILRLTINEDLAMAEGVPVKHIEAGYLLLLAIVVALAIKIVGVLLITALLIIPAASARAIAKTPEQMAIGASLFGILSVFIGIISSHFYDLPTGPAIVMGSTLIFIINVSLLTKLNKSLNN
jgi:zinc transport system permease protein